MLYECNPKHKEPWQRGRKGSLCPRDITQDQAQRLLEESVSEGKKRYAVHDGKAYCAQGHLNECWHGYPVGWREVPDFIRNDFMDRGRVTRREIKTYWNNG